jgi:hypothetical protein
MDRMGRRGGIPQDPSRSQQLNEQLQQTLGPALFEAWNGGRKLKYDIQP